MRLTKPMRKNFLLYFILAIVLAQLLLLIRYQYDSYLLSSTFDSDMAAQILFAEHLIENKLWFFSTDWGYSTEIWVVYIHLILTPMYAVFRDYNLAQTATALIVDLLIASSVYYCLSGTKNNKLFCIIGAAMCLIPYGSGMRYSAAAPYLQAGYYSFYMIMSFLSIGLYLRFASAPPKSKKRRVYFAFLVAIALLLAMSGIRYFLILFGPLCLACFASLVLDEPDGLLHELKTRRLTNATKSILYNTLTIIFMLAIALASYAVLFKGYLSPKYGGLDYTDITILDGSRHMESSINRLIVCFMEFLGFDFSGGQVLSELGIANYVMLFASALAFGSAVLLTRHYKKHSAGLRTYLLVAWSSLLIISLILLTTQSPDSAASSRYFKISCIYFIPMPAIYANTLQLRPFRKIIIVCFIAVIALAANFQMFATAYPQNNRFIDNYDTDKYQNQYRNATPSQRTGYIEYLANNGYAYGYASFWDANVSTVLSGGQVRFAAANDVKAESLSASQWLQPLSYSNLDVYPPEFVLMSVEEADERDKNNVAPPGSLIYSDDLYWIYDLRE